MEKSKLIGAMLASTLIAGTATAQDVTLTIESWRNDDLAIWQETKSSLPLKRNTPGSS
jgi:raffinose/stachyose/melibiose transport system substrate-binding protein